MILTSSEYNKRKPHDKVDESVLESAKQDLIQWRKMVSVLPEEWKDAVFDD